MLVGEKVPAPLHAALVAEPPNEPLSAVAGLLAHTV